MTQYTDTQLKQALEKMLPDKVEFYQQLYWRMDTNPEMDNYRVLDTEFLYLCWMVEEIFTLKQLDEYDDEVWDNMNNLEAIPVHYTWQQRTIALVKVKGVEIV